MADYKSDVDNKKINSESDKDTLQAHLVASSISNKEDALKKAWFKHVLLNIEKLYHIAEEVREEGISNLQVLRDDVKSIADEISDKVDKIINETTKAVTNLEVKEKESVKILEKTARILNVREGMLCSILSGFVGGVVAITAIFVVREIFFK